MNTFFSELNDEINDYLSMIYNYDFPPLADYGSSFGPDIAVFSKLLFYKKQNFIRNSLEPIDDMHAFYKHVSPKGITLQVGNPSSLPYDSFILNYKDSIQFKPKNEHVILHSKKPLELPKYEDIQFQFPSNFVWKEEMVSNLKLTYQLLGSGKIGMSKVLPWSNYNSYFMQEDFIRQTKKNLQYDCLSVNEIDKEIYFISGEWEIDENIIIPEGFKVYASSGLKLDLQKSAKILSYSPLYFRGDEDENIIIGSSDSTGQGIVLMKSKEPSLFEYVNFINLSNPSQNDWIMMGAITLYESSSTFSHCIFSECRSEDALNIIRSEFKIENSLFINNAFDSFVSDFSKGTIENTSFINNGNDALDFSGSYIELSNILVNGAGDKGVSAGEDSRIVIKEIEIINTQIAVAGKDRSNIEIDYLTISKSDIGITSFQKKPEYGPASISIKKIQLDSINIPYLVEQNSSLLIEGNQIKPSSEKLKQRLYDSKKQ